jgi:hypothetical protein
MLPAMQQSIKYDLTNTEINGFTDFNELLLVKRAYFNCTNSLVLISTASFKSFFDTVETTPNQHM